MIQTQIVLEKNKPRFVVMDYSLYEKLSSFIDDLEDIEDAKIDAKKLGPKIPFAVSEKILDGASPVLAWREHLGMTQVELAKKLKVSQAAVSHLENPKAKLQLATRKKLAKVFKCSADALVFDD